MGAVTSVIWGGLAAFQGGREAKKIGIFRRPAHLGKELLPG
jgi:hypothetical protein